MPNPTDEELYQGLQITNLLPSLTIGPLTWDNRPNVIRRADAFDAAARSHQHVPNTLNSVETSVDNTNDDVVTRWAEGNINTAEMTVWRAHGGACPCNSCVQDAYGRVQSHVGPVPFGYRRDCRCNDCMLWRRAMTGGIQGVLLGEVPREPVRTFNVSLSDILRDDREVRRDRDRIEGVFTEPNWDEIAALTAPPPRIETRAEREARELSMTPFERVRSRRGHPVPKLALAADWKPNQWEA